MIKIFAKAWEQNSKDLEKWFAEMYYGKSAQQVTLDGEVTNTGTTVVKFEGELGEWAK